MSNFDKVGEFHKVFNHPIYSEPQNRLFKEQNDENIKLLKFRFNLINEEVQELKDAITESNFREVVDALCDILYVTYGFGHVLGVDLNKYFNEIHQSNMSKMCKSEQEAIDTIEWYKNQSLTIHNRILGEVLNPNYYKSPTYEKIINPLTNEVLYKVYDLVTSKILKNINYFKPDINI